MKEIKVGDKVRLKGLKELEEHQGYFNYIGNFAEKLRRHLEERKTEE